MVFVRLVRPDRILLFIWADAYTFWIYQPAYLVAVFALVFRRWWLLGAACFVVAFHLAWVLPDYRPAQPIPAEAYAAPRIRLMTANVYFENPDYTGIADEIKDVDPDILFLQEYGPRTEVALAEAGVASAYPYTKIAYENAYFGTAMYSKLPLSDATVEYAGGRPYIRATIEIEGMKVVLYDLHPTSPGIGATAATNWNLGWKTIVAALRDEQAMAIAAGDFNMDQHHRWYRELKNIGLVSAHEERGRGNATSWPKGRRLPPIRIDQVFHTPGIVGLDIHEGIGAGSDHRPVIADLAILGP